MITADLLESMDAWGLTVMRFLLNVAWQSSLLFACVGCLCWALKGKRASIRRALWLTALVLTPFLPFTTSLLESSGAPTVSVAIMPPHDEPAAETRQRRTAPPPPPLVDSGPGAQPEAPFETAEPVPFKKTAAPEQVPNTAQPPVPAVAEEAPSIRVLDYPRALMLGVYVLGVTMFLAYFVVGLLRIRRWLWTATPCEDTRALNAFAEARERLGVLYPFPLLESGHISAPVAIGLTQHSVLLPRDLVGGLTPDELNAVALHETAHLRRGDPLVLTFMALLRAALFFHPLVWWVARQVALMAELAADESVLDAAITPVDYAKLLTRIAERLPRRTPSPEFAAGIVLSKSAFLRRVEAVLSDRRRLRRLTRWRLAAALAATALSIGVALFLPLSQRRDFYVTGHTEGVRLVAVRPNAEEQSFDGAGKPVDAPNFFARYVSAWKKDEWKREFVFQFAEDDEKARILRWALIRPASEERWRPSGLIYRVEGAGGSEYCVLTDTLAKKEYDASVTRRDLMDIRLRYFAGKRGEPAHAFEGPFHAGDVLESASDKACVLKMPPLAHAGGREFGIEFTYPRPQDEGMWDTPALIAYDRKGRWHLAARTNHNRVQSSATVIYTISRLHLDAIARITIGEEPHETTFHNVVISWPEVEERTHPARWDLIAERLDTKVSAHDNFGQFINSLHNRPRDAAKVADLLTSYSSMYSFCNQVLSEMSLEDLTEKDHERLASTARAWLKSPDCEVHSFGAYLGLWLKENEFVDAALEVLAEGVGDFGEVAHRLSWKCRDMLTDEQIPRMAELLLTQNEPRLNALASCLKEIHERPAARRALVALLRSDKPWLWHRVMETNDPAKKRWIDDLRKTDISPDEVCLRLAATGREYQALDLDCEASGAYAKLPELLTPALVRMRSGASWKILNQIDEHLDDDEATAGVVAFLGRLVDEWDTTEIEGFSSPNPGPVRRAVQCLNRWNGVNIGGLGTDPGHDGPKSHEGGIDWKAIAAAAVHWAETRADPSDLAQGWKPGEADLRVIWLNKLLPELSVVSVWTPSAGPETSVLWTPLEMAEEFFDYQIKLGGPPSTKYLLTWRGGRRSHSARGASVAVDGADLPLALSAVSTSVPRSAWIGDWDVWLEDPESLESVLSGTELFEQWKFKYLLEDGLPEHRPKVFFHRPKAAVAEYVSLRVSKVGWTEAEVALRNAMNRDWACMGQTLRAHAEKPSRQEEITAWKEFLERDDLALEMEVFAWYRLGNLYSERRTDGNGGLIDQEGRDLAKAQHAYKTALSIAPDYVCEATIYSSTRLPGTAEGRTDRARLEVQSYEWLVTRTDAMLESSAQRPKINSVTDFGKPIDTMHVISVTSVDGKIKRARTESDEATKRAAIEAKVKGLRNRLYTISKSARVNTRSSIRSLRTRDPEAAAHLEQRLKEIDEALEKRAKEDTKGDEKE